MPGSTAPPPIARHVRARLGAAKSTVGVGLVALAVLFVLQGTAVAAATVVPLATAAPFRILAGAGITNSGTTTVAGDIGTFPTTTLVGGASLTVTGTNHGGDGVTQTAKTDLGTAYNQAAGQTPRSPIVADLGGQVLTAGVYNSASSIGLTGAVTLNGAGNPDAVFVFQAGSTLITAAASQVVLTNGAQACNVFWQVGSSATLGTGSTFRGTIIALTDISLAATVTVHGRILARNGAVTLDSDTISAPACTLPTTTTEAAAPEATEAPTTTAAPTTTEPATTSTTARAAATTTTTARAAVTTTTSNVTTMPVSAAPATATPKPVIRTAVPTRSQILRPSSSQGAPGGAVAPSDGPTTADPQSPIRTATFTG